MKKLYVLATLLMASTAAHAGNAISLCNSKAYECPQHS